MNGKEYLNKKFSYIKKLSIIVIVSNLVYFYFKFAISEPVIDIETIYIFSLGINVLCASFVLNHVKDLIKSVK
ncbi:hypothetical protein SAMN05661096_01220 [Marivirga sericea]|uniref:Uncharacterized protein n=1 Tax=Marivirga sericea TaxID=1028 RepID=A0A1X7J2C0_9BACT|nr:hypothetical protein [Marivirga sericea]SMG21696.1 hypothetical protein SAMN05661096_01220 [Marivirga sericea]